MKLVDLEGNVIEGKTVEFEKEAMINEISKQCVEAKNIKGEIVFLGDCEYNGNTFMVKGPKLLNIYFGTLKDKAPVLEVGKWYKDERSKFLICIVNPKNKRESGYGFKMDGNWSDSLGSHIEPLIPATDKEVETALIKEAKKRGFKEGVDIGKCLLYDIEFSTVISTNLSYDFITGEFHLRDKEGLSLFSNGKWATIVEPKKEVFEWRWVTKAVQVSRAFFTKEEAENLEMIQKVKTTKQIRK